MYLTWLDSNSWFIELGGQHILLDPWLIGPLVFGQQTWLFKAERRTTRPIPHPIDLILLSQGLPDHAHPETLAALDRTIPVVASPNAARVVQDLGYQSVTVLKHQEATVLGDRLHIQAVPGSLVGPQQVENGYFLKDLATGISLYYEPHGSHSPTLQGRDPVDVVLTPIVDISILNLLPVIQGATSALQAVEWLRPQVIIPTAAGGDLDYTGLLNRVLQMKGDPQTFRQRLKERHFSTQLLEPQSGVRFEVPLVERSTNPV